MSSEARKVYDEAIVIDGLNVSNWESDAVFERLRVGNITAINATVATWENFVQTMAHLAVWMRRFRERQDIVQVKETADIYAAKKLGKTGIILSFQNASPIENELDRLGLFLALGVRVIQLTYHETNLLGSGCWERNDCGLSNFGVDAVREMNRLGIVIDLSHVGPKTTMDAIEMSEQPVAITHANARSFCDHPRNKEEEALKLLAEKGGVVGATSFANFLPKDSIRRSRISSMPSTTWWSGSASITWPLALIPPTISRSNSGITSYRSRARNFPRPLPMGRCRTRS